MGDSVTITPAPRGTVGRWGSVLWPIALYELTAREYGNNWIRAIPFEEFGTTRGPRDPMGPPDEVFFDLDLYDERVAKRAARAIKRRDDVETAAHFEEEREALAAGLLTPAIFDAAQNEIERPTEGRSKRRKDAA